MIVEPLPLMDLQNARAANDTNYTKKERQILKNIVDWVCVNVILFMAIMLNFLLSTFMHDLMTTFTMQAVSYMDRAGFEGHFIRFIQMTLFETEGLAEQDHQQFLLSSLL